MPECVPSELGSLQRQLIHLASQKQALGEQESHLAAHVHISDWAGALAPTNPGATWQLAGQSWLCTASTGI